MMCALKVGCSRDNLTYRGNDSHKPMQRLSTPTLSGYLLVAKVTCGNSEYDRISPEEIKRMLSYGPVAMRRPHDEYINNSRC